MSKLKDLDSPDSRWKPSGWKHRAGSWKCPRCQKWVMGKMGKVCAACKYKEGIDF